MFQNYYYQTSVETENLTVRVKPEYKLYVNYKNETSEEPDNITDKNNDIKESGFYISNRFLT